MEIINKINKMSINYIQCVPRMTYIFINKFLLTKFNSLYFFLKVKNRNSKKYIFYDAQNRKSIQTEKNRIIDYKNVNYVQNVKQLLYLLGILFVICNIVTLCITFVCRFKHKKCVHVLQMWIIAYDNYILIEICIIS